MKMLIRLLIAMCAVFVLVLVGGPTASAQDGDNPPPQPTREVEDDEVNAIAEQLYCPVCENVPLDVCDTRACADWRAEIKMMLSQGQTEEEIKAYFVNRYGQRVLAVPEARGINILVWVVPPLGVLAGIVILVLALRRMAPGAASKHLDAETTVRYDDLDPEYVARLEREVQEFTG